MPTVTFNKTANTVSLEENDGLIELEYKENNELPFGCKSAICGTCVLEVLAGKENLNEKNQDEKALLDELGLNSEKHRLGCQCVIHGDITIEPLNS